MSKIRCAVVPWHKKSRPCCEITKHTLAHKECHSRSDSIPHVSHCILFSVCVPHAYVCPKLIHTPWYSCTHSATFCAFLPTFSYRYNMSLTHTAMHWLVSTTDIQILCYIKQPQESTQLEPSNAWAIFGIWYNMIMIIIELWWQHSQQKNKIYISTKVVSENELKPKKPWSRRCPLRTLVANPSQRPELDCQPWWGAPRNTPDKSSAATQLFGNSFFFAPAKGLGRGGAIPFNWPILWMFSMLNVFKSSCQTEQAEKMLSYEEYSTC